MFNNSKYGNLLTVILIVSILAIIGVIGIIGYRLYKAYYIGKGASEAADAFESNVNKQDVSDGSSEIAGANEESVFNSDATVQTKYKGFDVIATIQIPSIDLKYPVLKDLTKKSLETSVVLLYTSNGVNQAGNTVIIGHNYRNGTMFSDVKKLENGDLIYITDTSGQKIKYTVYNSYITSGSDSEYMTRNTNGKREISLSTCTDDSKNRRIIWAKED